MTLADLDWRILRGSLIGLAVCLLVGGAVVYVSYQYSSAQELEFRNESRKLLTVRGRYQTIDEEERIIEEFLPRFLALEDRGVIGREYRLDWIETLRNASDELKLPELTYTIDTQSLYEAEIPFEEGSEVDVPSDEIGLVVGEAAHFRFFSSAVRKQDHVGDVLQRWNDEELVETDSLEATLSPDENSDEPYVPVTFHSRVTELGLFELWCVGTQSQQRWKLEFSVRQDAQ